MFSKEEVASIRAAINRNQQSYDNYWRLRHLDQGGGGWAVILPKSQSDLIVFGTLSEVPTSAEALSIVRKALETNNITRIPLEKIQNLAGMLIRFIMAVDEHVEYHSNLPARRLGK